jgi:hypothetical protein
MRWAGLPPQKCDTIFHPVFALCSPRYNILQISFFSFLEKASRGCANGRAWTMGSERIKTLMI